MPVSAPRCPIIRSPAVATILQGRCCDGPDRKSAYAKSQPCVVPVLMCHAPLLSKSPTRRRDKRSARFNKSSNTGLICGGLQPRSEEHTSELQSLMRISYAVFCLKQKN